MTSESIDLRWRRPRIPLIVAVMFLDICPEPRRSGEWKQVRYNTSLNNGPVIPGGYEEIIWNGFLDHDVVGNYVYEYYTP